jgi:hypothetical protein
MGLPWTCHRVGRIFILFLPPVLWCVAIAVQTTRSLPSASKFRRSEYNKWTICMNKDFPHQFRNKSKSPILFWYVFLPFINTTSVCQIVRPGGMLIFAYRLSGSQNLILGGKHTYYWQAYHHGCKKIFYCDWSSIASLRPGISRTGMTVIGHCIM